MVTVKLTTDATIPTDTSISVVVNEDTNQDGTADNTATQSIDDGSNEYLLSGLSGGGGNDYWLDIQFNTTDVTTTATFNSATVNTTVIAASVGTVSTAEPGIDILGDFVISASGGVVATTEPPIGMVRDTMLASVETTTTTEPPISIGRSATASSVEAVSITEPSISIGADRTLDMSSESVTAQETTISESGETGGTTMFISLSREWRLTK